METSSPFTTREAVPPPLLFKYRIAGYFAVILAVFCMSAPAAGLAGAEKVSFGEMYGGASSLGITLSEKLKSLEGKAIVMEGFMAPPLKPTLSFFVLTRIPMSICPFCSSDADWPYDIVVVRLERPVTALPFDRPIRVEGILELGSEIDSETGFVSLVRIRATRLEEV
ncbi:MAG: hypothetical protein LBS53_08670 [Synergistaceae bacterium]|nr:hypothetical protein [Synergistaceae bacterium]